MEISSSTEASRHRNGIYLVFLFFILISVVIYIPVLDGPFLLDDFNNLSVLQRFSNWQGWQQILFITFNNESGELGRPVSMFSFALQRDSWPDNSFVFKLTNLLIHLLNGLLIFLVINKITRSAALHRYEYVPVIVAGIWLIHPLNVSTVLYAVQRMTQLSTLFILLAILFYLVGRDFISRGKISSGLLVMLPGVVCCSVFSILAKENGVLVFLYIPIIELYLFLAGSSGLPARWYRGILFFNIMPLIICVLLLLFNFENILSAYDTMEFSATDRLLTETGVLTDYLSRILLFKYQDLGVFHDDYNVLDGIFSGHPAFPYLLILSAIALVGFYLRKTLPAVLFGVSWFFAGHVLESTFIPLELYFEHRNYLPMVGILFAVFSVVAYLADKFSRPVIFIVFSFITGSISTILLAATASPWSSDISYARASVSAHPNSYRARQYMASVALAHDQPDITIDYLQQAFNINQSRLSPLLMIIQVECSYGRFDSEVAAHAQDLASSSPFEPEVHGTLSILYYQAKQGQCPSLTVDYVADLASRILNNRNFLGRANTGQVLYALLADTEINRGNLAAGIRYYEMAYASKPDINLLLLKCGTLASNGRYDDATSCLEIAEAENDKQIIFKYLFKDDVEGLKQVVEEETTSRNDN